MPDWLDHAVDYAMEWIAHQVRRQELPGCAMACHHGAFVIERAFGCADLSTGERLTPRHRFRVASHSKSFTAAAIMRLREQGRLRLDDAAGHHVGGLHPDAAQATVGQLLSHASGITRDGRDSGQWADRRPFLAADELKGDLALPPVIEPNARFKYSNHAYGLAGMVIEAVAGEPFADFLRREIITAAGLAETDPDAPVATGIPVARGHSAKVPLGRRMVVPGSNPTRALAPATGVVSTAHDLVRFFAQLDPTAPGSMLSRASRREMIRRQWREPHLSTERYYGLGIRSGTTEGWDWFGHGGAFQGFASRTVMLPDQALTLSIVVNATDGPAMLLIDGVIHILQTFARRGPPTPAVSDWNGRWWSIWQAHDLVPMGDRVLVADPAKPLPFQDASELVVTSEDSGSIVLASGTGHHGERVRRTRGPGGDIATIWLAGNELVREADFVAEMTMRYGKSSS
jgi:CubicO group peptidase (beta-lactamase class C family)